MPIIATFYGLLVRMHHGDHGPPHVHAEYQGHRAMISLGNGSIMNGSLPPTAARLMREWILSHQAELQNDWTLAQAYQPLLRISGDDHD